MSKEFEQRFDEWMVWYREHHNDTDGIEAQVRFLRKAVEGLMELSAYAMRDIRDLEQRGKSPVLFTPRGLAMRP